MNPTLKKIWNAVRWVLVAAVVAVAMLLAGVRLVGITPYAVLSGSMEPAFPVGSMIYVKAVDPESIEVGDPITFYWDKESGVIATHRVIEIDGEGFHTKGDANEGEDFNDVPYSDLIGRVSRHYPMLGALMEIYTSNVGKVYVVCFAACGAMLNMLAGRLRERRKQHRAK